MKYKFIDMAFITPEDNHKDNHSIAINHQGHQTLYFQLYQNSLYELQPYCLYNFTIIINIGRGSKYTYTSKYIILSLSRPAAYH